MHVAPREGDVLPGVEHDRYLSLPTVMLLVAAPILSFAFVIFLPFIGLAMLVKAGVDKGAIMWAERAHHEKAGKPEKVTARVTK